MVAASRPVPRCGSHRRCGGSSSPCAFSHWGSSSRTCCGVHLPSAAASVEARRREKRAFFMTRIIAALRPTTFCPLSPLGGERVRGRGGSRENAARRSIIVSPPLTPAFPPPNSVIVSSPLTPALSPPSGERGSLRAPVVAHERPSRLCFLPLSIYDRMEAVLDETFVVVRSEEHTSALQSPCNL